MRAWVNDEQLFYIYVLDAEERLLGTVSLRALLLAADNQQIETIVQRDPISVPADMDQEDLARLFLDYDLVALPVVDGDGDRWSYGLGIGHVGFCCRKYLDWRNSFGALCRFGDVGGDLVFSGLGFAGATIFSRCRTRSGCGLGAIDHHAQRCLFLGHLFCHRPGVAAPMGLKLICSVLWLLAIFGGCSAHRVAEQDSWSGAVAVLLRAELDAGGARVAVNKGLVSRFYLQREDRLAWCGPTGPMTQADALLQMLKQAADDGLRPQDYAVDQIAAAIGRWRVQDSKPDLRSLVRLDVLLTRAFLAYGGHLQRGRVDPRKIHPEWKAPVQAADLVGLLQTALDLQQVDSALERLRPPQAGYNHLRQALAEYRAFAASGGWPEIGPKGGPELVRRLTAMGDLVALADEPSREQLAVGIAHFQERHGIVVSSKLDRETLAALNIPLSERLAAIELNMERWRWLPHDPGTGYILVRIADFALDAVEAGETVLNMRVIVGKPFWRTPIFSAKLTHLVFNPYWYIPRSIAVEEILPLLKRDISYLDRRDIMVSKGEGLALTRVDPDSIKWADIAPEQFEYAFTQVPGPANPLGRIKFIFPNPYHVYLHDTPNTQLFAQKNRAFSHGCIRLEKSVELAAHILRREGHWSLGQIEQELDSGLNREIALERAMPVYLLYWTTWIDAEGLLQFRQDEYDADENLHLALSRKR